MEWILSLLLVWGSMTAAADEIAKAEATQVALIIQQKTQQEAHEAEVEARMYDDNGVQALASEWVIMPQTTYPGDVVLVRSSKAGDLLWQNKTYPMIRFGKGYYTFLPISMSLKPGSYPIGTIKLTVLKKSFDTQQLTVTEEQEKMTQNIGRIQQDQIKVNKVRSVSEARFLFDQAFIQPVKGRLSTPYGFTRYVNGKFSGSHRAIDLANPEGTPVATTNAGKVVLAEELYLTGNSIYIDHGMNLFSQYAHLSKINVTAGDMVEAGQVIGLVGTTGFSTGPHLHFTFWVGSHPVNPNVFFDTLPFWWNTKSLE